MIRRKPRSRKAGRASARCGGLRKPRWRSRNEQRHENRPRRGDRRGVRPNGLQPPSTGRDKRDAALASNIEAFAAKLAASDEFSGVVLLTRHGQPLVRRGARLRGSQRSSAQYAGDSIHARVGGQNVHRGYHREASRTETVIVRQHSGFAPCRNTHLPKHAMQVTVGHLLTMSSGIPDLFRVPEFWARNRNNQIAGGLLEVLRDVAVAVPSGHPMVLQQLQLPSSQERSSSDRPAARLLRWSRPR